METITIHKQMQISHYCYYYYFDQRRIKTHWPFTHKSNVQEKENILFITFKRDFYHR